MEDQGPEAAHYEEGTASVTISPKQMLAQIIALHDRLDAQDKIILESIVPTMGILHDRLDRLERLETPTPLTKTGDEKFDALINDLARKDEIIMSLFTLVSTLQDELSEIKAHVFAQDHRLGRSISFDRMSR